MLKNIKQHDVYSEFFYRKKKKILSKQCFPILKSSNLKTCYLPKTDEEFFSISKPNPNEHKPYGSACFCCLENLFVYITCSNIGIYS